MKTGLLVLLLVACGGIARVTAAERPNVLYILCDDLGYGDVHALNPDGKIQTPAMDQLAQQGIVFTDAHSGSAVCTPTRYGVLTGRYSWRSRLQSGVLGGLSPRLIEQDRLTVAALARQLGYRTGCIGKWHLGMDWARPEMKPVNELNIESREQVWNVDYAQPIQNGPLTVGFDEYFGISASLDMVPYTFIRNDQVDALPTEDREFAMMAGRTGGTTRKGPAAPEFHADQVLPALTNEAIHFIQRHGQQAQAGTPFFLYVPLAAPHTPILPAKEWFGKSGLNPYADFVMQTDWSIGQMVQAVESAGLSENTIIIVTSDNGCSPQAKFEELEQFGHDPSYHFRGHKADIYEGGHRIPFIVRWPGHVPAGTVSAQTICLTDLMATFADITDTELPATAGEDSVSILPALLGTDRGPLREATVHHSINGSFAIRQGHWKLILCRDSGGWSPPRPGRDNSQGLPAVQLYDLSEDIGEQDNIQDQYPDIVGRLTALLESYVANGRSTPGPRQANAVEVKFLRNPEQR